MLGIGKMNVSGYNRFKQNARICFIMTAIAGILPAAKGNGAPEVDAPRIRSIVKVDARTHTLVRAVEVARPQTPAPPAPAIDNLVDQAAKTWDVNPLLVHSVIAVESNFDPYAVSPKGAQGIMQLMPDTARRFGVSDTFDPRQNIEGGVRYLKFLENLFGSDDLAVAAYNAGEHAVVKYNGIPPYRETVDYVKKVGARYGRARKQAVAKTAPPAPAETQSTEEKHPPLDMFYDDQGRVHIVTR